MKSLPLYFRIPANASKAFEFRISNKLRSHFPQYSPWERHSMQGGFFSPDCALYPGSFLHFPISQFSIRFGFLFEPPSPPPPRLLSRWKTRRGRKGSRRLLLRVLSMAAATPTEKGGRELVAFALSPPFSFSHFSGGGTASRARQDMGKGNPKGFEIFSSKESPLLRIVFVWPRER